MTATWNVWGKRKAPRACQSEVLASNPCSAAYNCETMSESEFSGFSFTVHKHWGLSWNWRLGKSGAKHRGEGSVYPAVTQCTECAASLVNLNPGKKSCRPD